MKSSSLKLLKEAGIPDPASYRDSLIHEWYLPDQYKQHVEILFLAKEETVILKPNIVDGIFKLNGIDYQVTWIHKPSTVYKSPLALLSFRYCKYLKTGYVLIKELENNPVGRISDFYWIEYNEQTQGVNRA